MHAHKQARNTSTLSSGSLPAHPLKEALGEVTFSELQTLRESLAAVADRITAYDAHAYDTRGSDCPLQGHCAAVAYLVRKQFGGDIIGARVDGEPHQWNRLPSGVEVDLSGEQFGLDGITPVTQDASEDRYSSPRKVPERKSVNKRFLLLEERLFNYKESSSNQ